MDYSPTVNRYLLFAGSVYYPSGGWDDFHADHANLESAIENGKFITNGAESSYDWFHIVDLETGKVVAEGQNGLYLTR
jgi:hypothetical protein